MNTPARRYLTFLLLVAPIVVLRLVDDRLPDLAAPPTSVLTNSSLLSGTNQFIGLDNYRAMLSDFGILSAIRFTLAFVLGSTLLQLIVGLLVALLLNAKFRGRGFARSINLIPWAIPAIVAAYAFRWLLDDQFGLIPYWINQLTGDAIGAALVGLERPGVADPGQRLEERALHGRRLPGRAAGGAGRPLRGGQGRRRQRLAAVLGDHVPHDPAAPDRAGDVLRGLAAGRVRPDLRSDERRPRRGHGDAVAAHLPGGDALLQIRLCLGRQHGPDGAGRGVGLVGLIFFRRREVAL